MIELKLIKHDTDLSELKISKIDWDVVIGEKQYQVVSIEDYYHSEGGRYGENNYWCYPLDEQISTDNLVAFNGNPVCWGFRWKESNYVKSKWYGTDIRSGAFGVITRNGKDFYEIHAREAHYAFALYQVYLTKLLETLPVCFVYRSWKNDLIGRVIKRNGIEYKITSIIEEQGCFIAYPNGSDDYIKCEYLDPMIEWYLGGENDN